MRHVYLVCYDISDDRRRTKVHRALGGFGTALQYSVFRCALTSYERLMLRDRLWELIHEHEDRVLLADLGPEDGRAATCLETWGQELEKPFSSSEPLIF